MSFRLEVLEVISSDTQKYASTHVSGGGGTIFTSSSVPAQVAPVRSSTTLHSDQTLWVRDVATGTESALEFSKFNISARPGHRLLTIVDDDSGKLERIHNLSTGDISYCDGELNPRKIGSASSKHFVATIYTVMIGVPMLNFLGMAAVAFQMLITRENWVSHASWRDRWIATGLTAVPFFVWVMFSSNGRLLDKSFGVTFLLLALGTFYWRMAKMKSDYWQFARGKMQVADDMLDTEIAKRKLAAA